jgi:hypothetical protein
MSIRRTSVIILLLLVMGGVAGCLSYSFGDAVYEDGTLHIMVHNSNEPKQVVLQVTIFNTTDFEQTEVYKQAKYYNLEQGTNEYSVPVDLPPGSYKLYLYIMVDGHRTNLEIRDIEV